MDGCSVSLVIALITMQTNTGGGHANRQGRTQPLTLADMNQVCKNIR